MAERSSLIQQVSSITGCNHYQAQTVLERSNWNQTEAAEQFRIPLSTLNQKIKRLNIEIRKKQKE